MNPMNKLSFGVSAIVSGQRKVAYEPELVVLSTAGGFRITPAISKALGIQHGDNVAFVRNVDAVQQAITTRDAAYTDWCANAGFDAESDEAAAAFHKEYDFWGIVKGYQLFNEKGIALKVAERLSAEDKKALVEKNFDEILAAAQASENDKLLEALAAAGEDHEAVVAILAEGYSLEKDKYAGSKAANSSAMTGVGVVLTFTDTNVWNQLADGKDEDCCRSFALDVDSIIRLEVNNGYENIEVPCIPFDPTVYTDTKVARGKNA